MSEVAAMRVDETNAEQARAWDGDEGAYWADNAERFDRAVAAHHGPFMDACAITSTDRVLDVGCGTGQTTRDAARAAASGSALGIDLSGRMVAYARDVATRDGISNVRFEQADAQVHPFPPEAIDAAISRTGSMFFGDPIAAFANIARGLRRGGRLVLLTWQGPAGNEWIGELSGALAAGRNLPLPPANAPGPFALSDPDRVRALLEAGGFTNVEFEARAEPMWFGENAEEANRFVLGPMGWMLEGLDDSGRDRALQNLRATVTDHQTGDGVLFGSAAWTIQATRA